MNKRKSKLNLDLTQAVLWEILTCFMGFYCPGLEVCKPCGGQGSQWELHVCMGKDEEL